MMPLENRTRQVIEIPITVSTVIPLTLRVGFIMPMVDYFVRLTVRTTYILSSRTAQKHLASSIIALIFSIL
uniref:Uncharacterized protein n=1 Tax=Candidatus Kentrum eta TaxID=2126337 RepID=A0A450VU14_9GAMM|nr:MAG: hypothetical protein BECKH772B_GA0070898_104992 [Candidatus Kentron sp. H]VFK08283.1 MAG: hypothetical protein BECKH772C_GA0070978_105002 [Candidatus Kentron sp. H]VFK09322.1 MAG: hypothetical protein BECKH772A_GA0070896_109801 [Candidatus Kentron sp. H]